MYAHIKKNSLQMAEQRKDIERDTKLYSLF